METTMNQNEEKTNNDFIKDDVNDTLNEESVISDGMIEDVIEEFISEEIEESTVVKETKGLVTGLNDELNETGDVEVELKNTAEEDNNPFLFIEELEEYEGESGTVQLDDPVLVENRPNEPFSNLKETFSLPAAPYSVLYKYSSNFPNMDIADSPENSKWLYHYERGADNTPFKDQFLNRLKKKGSQFKQYVDYEGQKLRPGVVKIGSNRSEPLSGERAVYWVKSVTGQGGIIQIPLWHSGFWISIKTPSEGSLLELNARIAEDKITFGRQTYGLAFANSSVYFINNIVDFVLDHLFDHTLKDVRDIRPYISSQDIHQLAWGMACAIWRNGFQFARAILNKDNVIGTTVEALLAVPKMNVIDNSALTEWQKSHMAGRHGKNMTLDSIEKYRSEFTIGHSRVVTLNEELDIKIELYVPNVDKAITAGQKWVTYLVSKVDSAMRITNDIDKRNEYVLNYGKASLLRQYCHWVKSITVKGQTFKDEDTIEALLDSFSSDDTIRDTYFSAIGKFIDDTAVSIIAVPALIGVDDVKAYPRFPYVVPIDPLRVFFTLLVQKALLITSRS